MDSAKHGVILFSLGSVLNGKDVDPNTKVALLKAFSKRKETILWKFEEDLPNIPENVHIRKWIPQNSILGVFKKTF
jgi:glucuronosyltransferase